MAFKCYFTLFSNILFFFLSVEYTTKIAGVLIPINPQSKITRKHTLRERERERELSLSNIQFS
jgi:hypothetical protein